MARNAKKETKCCGDECCTSAPHERSLMVKIRGLTIMATGAIAIGFGTGNLPPSIVAIFGGLALLLMGFTYLMG